MAITLVRWAVSALLSLVAMAIFLVKLLYDNPVTNTGDNMADFRKARIEDAEGIARVLMENYMIESEEEAISTFKKEFVKGHSFIVAIEDEKITCVGSWIRHGLPKHQLAWMSRFATLKGTAFEIEEELFSMVVQDAEQTFKENGSKLRKIFVYCHKSDKETQDFYEKIKLVKEAELKDHFYKGEDEIIYSMFFE